VRTEPDEPPVIAALVLLTCAAVHAAWRATTVQRVRRRFGRPGRPAISAHRGVRAALDRALRGRRERALDAALPDALDAVARSLRSGGSLRHSVADASGAVRGLLADDLRRVVADVDRGMALVDALERWTRTRPVPGVRLVAAALGLGVETGGASAQAIDGVAATLRINLGIAGEVRALSSQARLSALVIVLAPIAFALLATTTDRQAGAFLFGSPFGMACVAAGLALDGAGWLWMRRITAVVA
jgi:tight adherence protein B